MNMRRKNLTKSAKKLFSKVYKKAYEFAQNDNDFEFFSSIFFGVMEYQIEEAEKKNQFPVSAIEAIRITKFVVKRKMWINGKEDNRMQKMWK